MIQERLRFIPQSWSEKYEFTEADATHALDVIDSLMEGSGHDQKDPEKLPWDAIRSTLMKGVFGGRVTSPADQKVLDAFVSALFTPRSFDLEYKVVDVPDGPVLPDSTTRESCLEWIDKLPEYNLPTWIGLDANAEEERDKRVVESVVEKVGMLQEKCDQDSV